ncbi:MAG: response regulator [Actinomycetota bacterium]
MPRVPDATDPGWVLVVAADAVRGMALFRLLEWAGHRANVVDTARSALEMLEREPFELVLLDATLPDGFVVLRELRSDPRNGRLPVLLVALEDEGDTLGPWVELGADDVVTEPFVPALVRARVNACLVRKRLSDRDIEHRKDMERMVGAVVAAHQGALDEASFAAIVRRFDPLGRLGRAPRRIAAEQDP